MYILNKHFNNRAVSQVIAALLLIAIAVAAAVLVYVFSIGLLGSLQGGGGQQVKQQVILEAYNWNATTNQLSMSVRNVGTAGVTIASVFVNGVPITSPGWGSGCSGGVLPVQNACTITVADPGTTTPGVAYSIKMVTADGGVFSYSAIKGQAN
jgi:flagellin-like protein